MIVYSQLRQCQMNGTEPTVVANNRITSSDGASVNAGARAISNSLKPKISICFSGPPRGLVTKRCGMASWMRMHPRHDRRNATSETCTHLKVS
jgi:hypothetical protein